MKAKGPDLSAAKAELPADFARRLWAKDASLWKQDPAVQSAIRNRLGWLSLPADMAPAASLLQGFARDVRRQGFTAAVLLGMGGSSLCPEVLRRTFGAAKGALKLFVLDTTDPGALLAVEKAVSLRKTLFIVSSKSGGTIEVLSLFRYFYDKVSKLKKDKAGEHFLAVTDPGTSLEKLAREKGFRKIFTAPEDVGGRYSALTYFGLVPAALLGVDVAGLLKRAREFAEACGPASEEKAGSPLLLGAILGALAKAGRDKVTFVLSPAVDSFGLWVEQLIAESTGKEGRGLVPVEGEALPAPAACGSDRVFVHLKLRGSKEKETEARLSALEKAGHPVFRMEMRDRLDLGREFFRWEAATAAAGAALGVNPFDEPNVSESKANTQRMLAEFEAAGRLPEDAPLAASGSLSLWGDPGLSAAGSPVSLLSAHLARVKPGDYVALMAYLTPDAANHRALTALRRRIQALTGAATTLGYGPRFLHSTGQLHKGGAPNGVFIQVTCRDAKDPAVPGTTYGFSTLKRAQALGDFQAFKDHGLRAVRLHLSARPAADLQKLAKGLPKALTLNS